MSYNIPIIFDDSPFFEWGEIRRPQDRRNYRGGARQQPSLFQQWAEPEYFYEQPSRKQHYRPTYRGRETEREPQRQHRVPGENRFERDEEEDIYDEEHSRTPMGDFGFDGWEIPVQYMSKPTHRHHKHKKVPKQRARKVHHQHVANDCEETEEPQQTEVKKVKGVPAEPEMKPESGNIEKTSKPNPENQSKGTQEKETVGQQSVEAENTKLSSQTIKSDENKDIEIPISYTPRRNANKRHSKRLSQCDPPSLADIKLARIQSIIQRIDGIEEKISEFVDPIQNKNYLYISETLMKILLDLDTVDSEGIDIVRKARKEGVKTVQALVEKLENKLEENKKNSKK